jgi:hypothetical protein
MGMPRVDVAMGRGTPRKTLVVGRRRAGTTTRTLKGRQAHERVKPSDESLAADGDERTDRAGAFARMNAEAETGNPMTRRLVPYSTLKRSQPHERQFLRR